VRFSRVRLESRVSAGGRCRKEACTNSRQVKVGIDLIKGGGEVQLHVCCVHSRGGRSEIDPGLKVAKSPQPPYSRFLSILQLAV